MKLTIKREDRKAKYYPEDLGNGITLDMVLIPEGTFLMSSPQGEPDRRDVERPQHEVTVPSFFMGKYPVTQAQWQAVAALLYDFAGLRDLNYGFRVACSAPRTL